MAASTTPTPCGVGLKMTADGRYGERRNERCHIVETKRHTDRDQAGHIQKRGSSRIEDRDDGALRIMCENER